MMKYVMIALLAAALVFIAAVLFNGHADIMDWPMGGRVGAFFAWAVVTLVISVMAYLYSPLERDVEYID